MPRRHGGPFCGGRTRGRCPLVHHCRRGRQGRARSGSVVPTVTVSLSSLDFMRLGCGRTTAAQLEGNVAVEGDVAVGRQVLESMNFMF